MRVGLARGSVGRSGRMSVGVVRACVELNNSRLGVVLAETRGISVITWASEEK